MREGPNRGMCYKPAVHVSSQEYVYPAGREKLGVDTDIFNPWKISNRHVPKAPAQDHQPVLIFPGWG